MKRFWEDEVIERLDRGISENTHILAQKNIPIKVKRIADLSK